MNSNVSRFLGDNTANSGIRIACGDQNNPVCHHEQIPCQWMSPPGGPQATGLMFRLAGRCGWRSMVV